MKLAARQSTDNSALHRRSCEWCFFTPFFVRDLIEREKERAFCVRVCVCVYEREKERDVSQSGFKKEKSKRKMSPRKGKTRQKA